MSSAVIRLHSLGDIVLAEPAARYLAGSGEVHFAVREAYAPLVRRMGQGVYPLVLPQSAGFMKLRSLLKGVSPALILDLQANLTTLAATWPGRVRRFHLDRRRRRGILRGDGGRMPYRAEAFLRLAGGEGSAMPHLERRSKPDGSEPVAGLVAGGRWVSKSIPAGVLAEVARQLVDLHGMRVVVLGSSQDAPAAEEVVRRSLRPEVCSVAGEGDVERLIRRIEGLSLLVSPDSGPAHLAAALGVPLVVVFNSTHPSLGFWPPEMENAVLSAPLDCRPCHRHGGAGCPSGSWECRLGLMPGDIVAAAVRRLEPASSARKAGED